MATAYTLGRPIHPKVTRAVEAAEQWARCPCDAHAAQAEAAQFDPQPLWTNCNDLAHITKIAANHVARAASAYGEIGHAAGAAYIMAHPFVFEPFEVWCSLVHYIRGEIFDQNQPPYR